MRCMHLNLLKCIQATPSKSSWLPGSLYRSYMLNKEQLQGTPKSHHIDSSGLFSLNATVYLKDATNG